MYKNALSGLASGMASAKKPVLKKTPIKQKDQIIKVDPRESNGGFNKKPEDRRIKVDPRETIGFGPKQPKPGMGGTPPSIQNPVNSIKNEQEKLARERQNPSKPRRPGPGSPPPRMY